MFRKTVSPALPWHPVLLNDSRYNSSNTGAGVLEAFIGHGTVSSRK
ncbi:hypothetical protein AVEN_242379-1, partial [Araneus ventricosus]